MSLPSRLCLAATLLLTLPGNAAAQQPLRAATLITAFLADSGVPTRGMDWSTGNGLSVRWASARPVANPDQSAVPRGLTLARIGTARVIMGEGAPVDVTVSLAGNANGIQRVSFGMSYNGDTGPADPKDRLGRALTADGIVLTSLKCDRAKEGLGFATCLRDQGSEESGLGALGNVELYRRG